jgi:hypothetical protein
MMSLSEIVFSAVYRGRSNLQSPIHVILDPLIGCVIIQDVMVAFLIFLCFASAGDPTSSVLEVERSPMQ